LNAPDGFETVLASIERFERAFVFKLSSVPGVCMDTSRVVTVAAVLAAVGMTVAAPVAAVGPVGPVPQAGDSGTADNGTADGGAENRTVNGSFGSQVSSFMQASAASANSSVESGVW